MAAKVTIDPVSREIQINSGVTEINVRVDLYSDLKEDWLANPSLNRFEFPFRPVAGDSIGLGQTAPMYFFLKYPWVVKTAGVGSFVRLALNLYGQNEDGTDVRNPFLTVPGDSIQNEVSNIPGFDVLTQLAVQQSSFNDYVIVDRDSPYSGTDFPKGTGQKKLNNIPDAVTVAKSRGFAKLVFHSNWTLGAESHLDHFILEGRSHVNISLNIEEEAQVYHAVLVEIGLTGVLDGGNSLTKCIVGDITYLNGHIHDSALAGRIALAGNRDAYIVNCSMSDWDHPPIIDMGSAGQDLIMIQFTGLIGIENMHSTNKVGIGLVGGVIRLDKSSVTSGMIQVSGTGRLTDTDGNHIESGLWNGGVTIINELISSDSMSSGKVVYIDTVEGNSGIAYPLGELNSPVNNLSDAILIAENYGITKLHVSGSLSIGATDNVSEYTLFADRSLGNSVTVAAGATTHKTYFENLTVSGTMNGSVRYTTCVLGAIHRFDGGAKNSLLTSDIGITGNGANYFTECDTYITDSSQFKQIDIGDKLVNLIRCRGNYEIEGKTGPSTTAIDLVAGTVLINNTCNAGEIFLDGIVHTIDNSAAGCTVTLTNALDTDLTVDAIWKKDLSGYGANMAGNTLVKAEDEIRQAGKVYWDASSTNVGTDYPIGSINKPAKNLADVLTICERYGIKDIWYSGWNCAIGATDFLKDYTFTLFGYMGGITSVASTADYYMPCYFRGYLMGTFSNYFIASDCDITGIALLTARFKSCRITRDIRMTGNISNRTWFDSCEFLNWDASVIEVDVGLNTVFAKECNGKIKIVNYKTTEVSHISLISGSVTVDHTCTAGEIIISGANEVIDNSAAGCTVTIISSEVNIQEIVDGVWDEPMADHLLTGSTGNTLASSAGGGGDPTIIAAAVWNEPVASHVAVGSFGWLLYKVKFWINALRRLL